MKRFSTTIRRSQLITTYGPGTLVDLPDSSVIMASVDDWLPGEEIIESRLLANLQARLTRSSDKPRQLRLAAPAPHDDRAMASPAGAAAYQFPTWMLTRETFRWHDGGTARAMFQLSQSSVKVSNSAATYTDKLDLPDGVTDTAPHSAKSTRKTLKLVPIRFVAACPNGHIDDINWRWVVHAGARCSRQMWLVEQGTAGELRGSRVVCECGAQRQLTDLIDSRGENSVLGRCDGCQPWLGPDGHEWYRDPDGCVGPNGRPHPLRLLVRHASNAHFSTVVRALSLPERGKALEQAFEELWQKLLCGMDDTAIDTMLAVILTTPIGQPFVQAGGSVGEAQAMIAAKRAAARTAGKRPLTEDELDLFLRVEGNFGDDNAASVFTATRVTLPGSSNNARKIGRIVLVKRLREVQALIGFTRLESPPLIAEEGDEDEKIGLSVRMAPIARELSWIPATENRGEGLFVMLDPTAVQAWMMRPELVDYARSLEPALKKVTGRNSMTSDTVLYDYVGRMLIHTLSHALLQQIALESGYASASIRERIYARAGDHLFGVLLYTSSPDAEGTLGGLVSLGNRLGPILERALDAARMCSHDPVCSHQGPDAQSEIANGAACHGCMFVSESSCVLRNQLLDRALLVPTLSDQRLAFFE
jgi:hypothetical protein